MTSWKGKSLIPDHKRNVDREMIEVGLETSDIAGILDKGKQVRRRRKGVIEKWYHRGKVIYIIAVEDCQDYWLIRHVGKISATKEKLRLLK
jgi:predicted PolB exonuclease-like 3'-5' exonuclease